MSRATRYMLIAVLFLGLGAAACTKKAEETSTPAPAPAGVTVATVDLGRTIGGDKHVTDATTTFKPNDTIYASVLTSGTSSGSTLTARWTYQDGQVVSESQQTIAPTGDAATEFHISKPDGWPAGKYKLELILDGSTVQTKEFEVK